MVFMSVNVYGIYVCKGLNSQAEFSSKVNSACITALSCTYLCYSLSIHLSIYPSVYLSIPILSNLPAQSAMSYPESQSFYMIFLNTVPADLEVSDLADQISKHNNSEDAK